MAQVFPIASPSGTSQPVRSPGWSVHQVMNWSTIIQKSPNGTRLAIPLYPNNPLWSFEWTYGYIKDNTLDIQPANVPYTDLQILKAFYFGQRGPGAEFIYQPWDSVRGGSSSITSVSITSNIATITANQSYAPGLWTDFSGLTGASFLNGQTKQILNANSKQFTVAFTHANYGPTADAGTAFAGELLAAPDANSNSELVHLIGAVPNPAGGFYPVQMESVQELNGGSPTIHANGALFGAWSLQNPNTTAPYEGFVIHFTSAPTTPIIASFTYYYRCAFSEDLQDYEYFMFNLAKLSSLKFEQVRVGQ